MRTFPLMLVIVAMASLSAAAYPVPGANAFSFIPGLSQETLPSQDINAEQIYKTKNFKVDQDVKNVVVFIPSPMVRDQRALPRNTTLVDGTAVIFVNGQIYTDHGIVLRNEQGQVVFNQSSLPYKHAVVIRFDKIGKYTFSSSDLSTYYGKSMNGTINVIDNESATSKIPTNSNPPTIGLLIVPANQQDYFDSQLSRSGFNIIDSYTFDTPLPICTKLVKGFSDSAECRAILYVYGLDSDSYETIIKNVDTQLVNLQSKLLNP